MIQDDLRDPTIWKRVQNNRQSALLKYDQLWILAADESWHATAIVTLASNTEAHLRIVRVGDFREQSAQLWQDETYRVVWRGSGGFGVERIADGVEMGVETWPDEAGAIAAIRRLYPSETGGQVIGG